MTIRPYQPCDDQRMAQIHDAARMNELRLAGLTDAFLPFAIAVQREDFFAYPHIDVALMDDEIVAFSAYTDEEMAWLYVDPAMARQGIGRAMVDHALKQEPGICCVEALCGNEPARRLYESMGFAVEEIVQGSMPGNEAFQVRVYSMTR